MYLNGYTSVGHNSQIVTVQSINPDGCMCRNNISNKYANTEILINLKITN